MARPLYRAASWVLVVVLMASSLAAILGTAAAASTTYALTGFVDQPGAGSPAPVPAGVTVDLTARASGQVYTTTTSGAGGEFTFTSTSTSGALGPGYWGLSVPAVANESLSGCRPYRCAVLPEQQTPVYRYYNSTVLTNSTYAQLISNISVLPYNATLNGTVRQGNGSVPGATVELLAPDYAGLVLDANVSNATGYYNITVPFGSWVLQVTHTSGSSLYTNTTPVTISSTRPPHVNPVLTSYAVSGRIYSSVTHAYVTTPGNATLYDPATHYLYSDVTSPGGYYAFPSYPANFTHGSQTLDVVIAPVGFEPTWYSFTVNSTPSPYVRSVTVTPSPASTIGYVDTQLNFATVSPTTGSGTLYVNTSARLGNDSVVPGLPNGSVGQLWAQLGLDYNHSLTYPASQNSALQTWIGSQGPFFPPSQAGATIGGINFVAPTGAQALTSFSSGCTSGTCGLASSSAITYAWQDSYALNGTITKNASSYVIAFKFAHPSTSADVFNYTIFLPKNYSLYADTQAPTSTNLVGKGPEGDWTNFTLESTYSSTPYGSASFTIVRQASFTANVAASSTNYTFSSRNVANATHYNYTVVLGVGENVTFSASPSVYPAGQNGTIFRWNFGDGTPDVNRTYNESVYHTYTRDSPTGSYFFGTLAIVSSSGATNSTTFNVSVVSSSPTAGIVSNASKGSNETVGSTHFLYVNWSTVLQFNATGSVIPKPNNLSSAVYTITARGFSQTENYSASAGANPYSNYTFAFGTNTTNNVTGPGHGVYINLSTVKFGVLPSGVKGWGWIYNLTLQVWTFDGTTSTTTLTILVNDTEPPVPQITLLTQGNAPITSGSIVEGPNHYAVVRLDANLSVDLGNGSIVKYVWWVNNTNTTTFTNLTWKNSSLRTDGSFPTLKLPPETTVYHIRVFETDKNGNTANTSVALTVAENTTLRPVMEANNLTGPSTVNAGTSYTWWVNVTVGGGTKAVADDITVWFYLLSPSGTGSRQYIGGSPGSVTYYGYSNTSKNATVNSTELSHGSVSALKYGYSVRAYLTWTPSKSGSFILYAYATATNQFVNNSTVSITSVPITVHPNPTTELIEYGGIAAGVVVVILALVLFYRRRGRARRPGTSKPSSGRSGLERGRDADDDE